MKISEMKNGQTFKVYSGYGGGYEQTFQICSEVYPTRFGSFRDVVCTETGHIESMTAYSEYEVAAHAN